MKRIVKGKEARRIVLKQGDSLALTIPPAVIEHLGIRRGDPIDITDDGECMIVRKYRTVRAPAEGGDI